MVAPDDSLDVCLGDFINVRMEKELPPSVTIPMPIERVSAGQYRFNNKVIMMKEVNNHIVGMFVALCYAMTLTNTV